MEIGNLPEKEFRTVIVKMIQDLGKRMEAKIEKRQEMFIKDLQEIRKNKQTEMNNTLEGIHGIITEAEESINDLEDRMVEITAKEQNIEKRMKRHDDSLRDPWDNSKCTNIRIRGIPEEEKRKGCEKLFEDITEKKFPSMGNKIATQVQEDQ